MDSISDSDSEDAGSIPAGTTFYAYIIKSLTSDYIYKGHCQDVEVRLKQHNAGLTKSIRSYVPFELIYFERFNTLSEAVAREKYFKSAAGRRFIKSKLNLR